MVQALDADEDGHGTAECEAAPGDDCDDDNAQIHPGANETCDGFDNDCDELVDLDDGLELGGETRSAGGMVELDMAWIPGEPGVNGDEQFRLAYIEGGTSAVWSALLDSSGALGQRRMVSSESGIDVRLAGGTTTFGLTYQTADRALGRFLALPANSNSAPVQGTSFSYDTTDVAPHGSGEWVVASIGSDAIATARYLGTGGRVRGPLLTFNGQPTPNPSWVRIAANGDASAVVWQTAGSNLLRWSRLNSDLVATDGVSLGTVGYRPDIVASGTGYAMAWDAGSGIGFMRATVDGTEVCKKALVPLGLDQASSAHRLALADSRLGTLALVTSAAGQVILVRFGPDCEPSAIVPVPNNVSAGSPAIAAGNGSVALAWVHTTNSTAYTRLVGELLCE